VTESDGKLSCTRTITRGEDAVDSITFTNEYKAPEETVTSVTRNVPTVTKEITGDTPDADETFTFTLTAENADMPMPSEADDNQSLTKTIKGAGKVKFGTITFDKAGTYSYTVTEEKGSATGYTYDESAYTVTYDVTESDGKLSCTRTITKGEDAVDSITFTNEYTAPEETVTSVTRNVPTVTKEISGDTPDTDETFTFTLTAEKADMPMPTEADGDQSMTKTIKGTGRVKFGTITFDKAGTYSYTVTENKGDAEGYTYDESTYTVTYDVTESDGKLSCTRTITKDGAAADNITFTNEYTAPEETVTPVTRNIPMVTKEISGDTPDTDETFTFTLKANESGSPMPAEADGSTTLQKSINGAGRVSFGAITFDKAGTYSYTVTEEKGSAIGYTYDKSTYTVTYDVTESDGKLSCTRTITKGEDAVDSITFTNEYTADEQITPVTRNVPTVTKTISGDTPDTDETFTFTLTADNGSSPMPAEADGSMTLQKSIDGAGRVRFGTITFDKAGTYSYTVTEKKGSATGYTYDESTYTVTYDVTESDDKLNCTRTITKDGAAADNITFTNEYTAPEETVTPVTRNIPTVTKEITGDTPDTDETFTFTLKADNGSSPMPAEADGSTTLQKSINGAGRVSFGAITFDKAGTYSYTVTENMGSAIGYTYDESTYTVTYDVTESDGKLSCTHTITKGEDAVDSITFTNEYTAPEETVTSVTRNVPTVTKEISGDTPDTDETFTFTLTAEEADMPMPAEADGDQSMTKMIKGTGRVKFGTITFDKAGTYSYTVTEEKGSAEGYTYDESMYTVTYEVTESDGKLSCTRTIAKDGKEDSTLTTLAFTNNYQAPVEQVTSVTRNVPTVTKEISGDTPDTDETFTFTLTANESGSPMPAEADGSTTLTKSIDGAGRVKFGTITFDKAGTYSYTVTEKKGDAEGYTYDESTYTVTYDVTESDGKLNCTRTITKGSDAVDSITFTNEYKKSEEPETPGTPVTPSNVQLPQVVKEVTGDNPGSATFAFTLITVGSNTPMPAEANGSSSLTKTIAGSGTVDFGSVTFDEAGTYVYTVYEEAGNAEGYTYDDTVYMVTYEVTEASDGTLSCTRTIQKDGRIANSLSTFTFINSYEKPEEPETPATPINEDVPTVTKTISGDEPEEKENFTFTLTAAGDGAPMPSEADGGQTLTKTVEGEGTVDFGTLTFSEAGTYSYTVSEVKGDAEGYTYDESTYTVTYEVTETSDGQLSSTRTITKNGETVDGITFTNEYQKPVEPAKPIDEKAPTVTKKITGDEPEEDETFEFTLTADKSGTPMPAEADGSTTLTKSIKGEGTVDFGSLTFSEAGTYSYTVSEVKGDAEGYTYDESIYTVTYDVTESDGKLSSTCTIMKGDEAADSITFTNEYQKAEEPENPDTPDTPETSVTPITVDDPPVKKVISGDDPATDATFTFKMTADPKNSSLPSGMAEDSMPMPADAKGSQSLTKTVTGEGSVEFGDITFSDIGIYVYEVSEVKGDAEGYTYDDTVYTVTYVVTETDGKLSCTRTIQMDGKEDSKLTELTFTNNYKKPTSSKPTDNGTTISSGNTSNASGTTATLVKTGDDTPIGLWIGVICIAGAVFVILIVAYNRRKKKEKEAEE
jgi:pilin isopeptide linkage protein